MSYVWVGMVVVGLIGLLNLLLTFGVIRRLREHTEQLSELRHGSDIILPAGATVGEFTADTIDGIRVSRDGLAGRTVVSFFSPHCAPCRERMPEFIEYAGTAPGGRSQVLAVVVGTPADAVEAVTALTPVAQVVVEPDGGAVSRAFAINGFPALCLVDERGTVLASGSTLDELPSTVVA
ncbi:TlpA family protein [Micromonospora polyrhachis]|uniref:Thiol-disulfide isomerase/thioredoxin n=1 Tax=Micromonospora polyrhachis TaxID=1282883 RepID=A0A7W7WMD0_9ACTN|nr:TlpA disulfide reductase family protein [Micromonospora polyrhachis]MBB4956705.1 thiol-disulfide isomerase/thioredoxin [Micromonospora polyrhachis]